MSRKLPSKATGKLQKNILQALQRVQVKAVEIEGFSHFTHEQVWNDFPSSLRVSCNFYSLDHLQQFELQGGAAQLTKSLQLSFLKVGIKFRDIRKNIVFKVLEEDLK